MATIGRRVRWLGVGSSSSAGIADGESRCACDGCKAGEMVIVSPEVVDLEPNCDFAADSDGSDHEVDDDDDNDEDDEDGDGDDDDDEDDKEVPKKGATLDVTVENDPPSKLTRREVLRRLRESAKKHTKKAKKIKNVTKIKNLKNLPKNIKQIKLHLHRQSSEEHERDPEREYHLQQGRWHRMQRSVSNRWKKLHPHPQWLHGYDILGKGRSDVQEFHPDDTTVARNLAQAIEASGLPPPQAGLVPAVPVMTGTTVAVSTAAASRSAIILPPGLGVELGSPRATITTTCTACAPAPLPAPWTAAAIMSRFGYPKPFIPKSKVTAPPPPPGLPGIVGMGRPVTSKRMAATSVSAAMGAAGQGLMGITTWAAW